MTPVLTLALLSLATELAGFILLTTYHEHIGALLLQDAPRRPQSPKIQRWIGITLVLASLAAQLTLLWWESTHDTAQQTHHALAEIHASLEEARETAQEAASYARQCVEDLAHTIGSDQ